MLEVRKLSKRFGGVAAVSEASLEVAEGAIVALIGPNGAGKTTLFAAISGFVRPDSGGVRFAGADITGLRTHYVARAGVGRTFQSPHLFAELTLRENLLLAAQLSRAGGHVIPRWRRRDGSSGRLQPGGAKADSGK